MANKSTNILDIYNVRGTKPVAKKSPQKRQKKPPPVQQVSDFDQQMQDFIRQEVANKIASLMKNI
jgi:hypothetical protein